MSDDLLTEEVKARVPQTMKAALTKIAKDRHLKPADIIREALRDYVQVIDDRAASSEPTQSGS